MDIAVIGSGQVGGTLARGFAAAGHRVRVGSRNSKGSSVEGVVETMSVGDALRGAEAVVLTIPASAVATFLEEHGAALDGALVVDATNDIGGGGPANSHDAVLHRAPGARYVRAFNTLGFESMAQPRFGSQRAAMFFSAPEADADSVANLIEGLGMRPVYVGPDAHETVDGALRLWMSVARRRGRRLAFALLDAETN